MNCNCGGVCASHNVTRNKEIVGRYEKCGACGRVEWTQKPPATILEEIRHDGCGDPEK